MEFRILRRALIRKAGCEEDRQRHHIFYFVTVEGKKYRTTKISHSASGTVPSNLVPLMARQMRMMTREFTEFVNCTISKEKWLELWGDRGHNWR